MLGANAAAERRENRVVAGNSEDRESGTPAARRRPSRRSEEREKKKKYVTPTERVGKARSLLVHRESRKNMCRRRTVPLALARLSVVQVVSRVISQTNSRATVSERRPSNWPFEGSFSGMINVF